MAKGDYTTIMLKKEDLAELRKVAKLINEESGLELSDVQTLKYLINVYSKGRA
jgi:hypothetical protein